MEGAGDSEDSRGATRERDRESESNGEEDRERERGSSSLRVSRRCVMAQRGGNTEVGTRCPLGPVPIPSTAITYNNDGLMEPVGDLTLARKRERKTPRGRYEGIHIYRYIYTRVYTYRYREGERGGRSLFLSVFLPLFHPLPLSLPLSFTLTRSFILPFGESRFLLPSIDFPLIYLDSKTMTKESRGAVGIGK